MELKWTTTPQSNILLMVTGCSLILAMALLIIGLLARARIPGCKRPLSHNGTNKNPPTLPVLESLSLFGKKMYQALAIKGRKYDGLFCIRVGVMKAVVLSDWSAIKQAFVLQGRVFAGRPKLFLLDHLFERKGIAFNDGPSWKCLRSFCIKHMGFQRIAMENTIIEEALVVVRTLLNCLDNSGAEITKQFYSAILNVTWMMVADKRFSQDDPELESFRDNFAQLNLLNSQGTLLNSCPMLRFVIPGAFNYRKGHEGNRKITNYIQREIEEHRNTMLQGHTRDFIDICLQEFGKQAAIDPTSTIFNDSHMVGLIRDLFFAGLDTSDTILCWTFLYMIKWPQVQAKVHKEMDSVIGRDRLPNYNDRYNLPYTSAVLLEANRMASVVPLAVPHATSSHAAINGYDIPEGSMIIPNLWAVHNDPNLWGDPANFRPERFLDESGKIQKPEFYIPFSTGPRMCLGSSLAEMIHFLFFTVVMQSFEFLATPQDHDPSIEPVFGVVMRPSPFRALVQVRQ